MLLTLAFGLQKHNNHYYLSYVGASVSKGLCNDMIKFKSRVKPIQKKQKNSKSENNVIKENLFGMVPTVHITNPLLYR